MGNCVSFIKSSGHESLIESENITEFTSMETDTLTTELHTAINPESLATKREFHSEETSTYWLPKDKDEHERLTGQHFIYKELLGGNISSSAKETLDFEGGISILDVGCGSGVWMADMSSEYPNCTYHGCDIIDAPVIIQKLAHLNFSYGNVIQKLPYEDNTFDFVRMGLFVWALRANEWPIAIKEVIRVVKPGGIVQFVDVTPLLPKDKNSTCYRTTEAIINFATERGQNPNIAYELEGLVSEHSNVKVVQSDIVPFNTNSGTHLAKKFIWDAVKAIEGMMKYLGPRLGVESKEEISEYLKNFKQDMFTNDFEFTTISLSLQKID
ncbi:S-adenosyl-L-methionine-dependent methyltransferase [Sporodiniella umbellata]|nr:S-adenosyl-L-methionine-dependent methyltransferase [Sporodiniella umbellata]